MKVSERFLADLHRGTLLFFHEPFALGAPALRALPLPEEEGQSGRRRTTTPHSSLLIFVSIIRPSGTFFREEGLGVFHATVIRTLTTAH